MKDSVYWISFFIITIVFGLLLVGTLNWAPEFFVIPMWIVGAILLPAYLVVSVGVFVYWFFEPGAGYRFRSKHKQIASAVYIGAFLTCGAIANIGIKGLIGPLLETWGLSMAPEGIATVLAASVTLFLTYVFIEFERMRWEYRQLLTRFRMQEEKEKLEQKLKYMTEEQLKAKVAEFKERKEVLRREWGRGPQTPEETEEEYWLIELLDYLKHRIESL